MTVLIGSIQERRDTAANWTANNPILLAGALGIETDDLLTAPKYKIGDGVTAWNGLPYASSPASIALNDLSDVIIAAPASGDILYYDGVNWVNSAAGNGITSLNGLVAAIQTFVNDTNITIVSSVSSHTITWAGTLAAIRGGTGFGSYAVGDILYANTTTTLTKLVVGSNGQVLTLAGGVPTWAASSGGITSLNGLTATTQTFATGTTGTDFNISSVTSTHTFNLPIASAINTGKLSNTDWSTFNSKEAALTFSNGLTRLVNNVTNDLITGKAGGQTVIGGTAASENLILSSTSHATKGQIQIGTATTADATAELLIATSSTLRKALVLEGVSGQVANLQEWKSSTGDVSGSFSGDATLPVFTLDGSGGARVSFKQSGSTKGSIYTISGEIIIETTGSGSKLRLVDTGEVIIGNAANPSMLYMNNAGRFGIGGGITSGTTAQLHFSAGTTSTPPIRLTSGPLTTGGNILAGNLEFLTDRIYFTQTTGTTVQTIAYLSDIAAGGITGSGTINTVAKFTASGIIGNSSITDTGTLISLTQNTLISGNLGIGTSTFQASMTQGITIETGVAPSGNVADQFAFYSADIAAGNAAPHFRTELGDIIKLYNLSTGWTISNVTTDRVYDANSTTVDELADVLGTLINDLKLSGLIT